jgi:predicted transcriptional regulator
MLKDGEMPPKAVDILKALPAGEQICAGDLKKKLRFSDTTMYRNLHFLEKKGLVERIEERPESKNGRPKYTKSRGRGRKPMVFWRRV